jgi:hypothetical protein
MSTTEWTTGDGQKVRICDMGNRHLENTIKMLKRRRDHYHQQASNAFSSGFQGEAASECADAKGEECEALADEAANLIEEMEQELGQRAALAQQKQEG